MNTAERRVLAGLWSLQGVGAQALAAARELAPPEQLLSMSGRALASHLRSFHQAQDALHAIASLGAAADLLERRLAELGHQICFKGDPHYPARLAEWREAPPLLFFLGPAAAVAPRRRVALVGARHPETGFLHRATDFAEQLARRNLGIISGAAEGVDFACHRGALRCNGETWAFLGSSIEQMDAQPRRLLDDFRNQGGTFFTEFPPGTRADRSTFPRRNRLISGSADVVVVLRAGENSGALYTARYATEQGRPLFAMPGDAFNHTALGCLKLISDGHAQLCLSSAQIVEASGGVTISTQATSKQLPLRPVAPLSAEVQCVLDVLTRSAIDFDSILARTRLSSGVVVAALLELELSGLVFQRPGRRYEKVE